MSSPSHQAFLFDLDGTLIDSVPDIATALSHALEAAGLPGASLEETRTLVGDGARVLLARAFANRDREMRDEDLERLFEFYGENTLRRTVMYDGMRELLDELHARRPRPSIAIVTNKELSGPGCTVAHVLDATESVVPAVEIIDSRYENFNFDLKSVIADNGRPASLSPRSSEDSRPLRLDIRSAPTPWGSDRLRTWNWGEFGSSTIQNGS